MSEVEALGKLLGERVREIRVGAGKRQEDVAAAAQDLGFDWNRATVAAIELGRRELSAAELLPLTLVLECELADLLPQGDGWAKVSEAASFSFEALREIASGRASQVVSGHLDVPLMRRLRSALAESASVNREVDKWWPEKQGIPYRERRTHGTQAAVIDAAVGEAEQKCAKRLGLSPVAVSALAFRLWDRSLTSERDRRVAEGALPVASARTLQALRGHVTRGLTAEIARLAAEVKDNRPARPKARGKTR